MPERKPMFMGDEGFHEEMAITDSMQLGGLAMGGNIVMATHKITGLGAATADNDALAYGQAGGNLAGLSIDTNPLTMGSQKITGLAAGQDPGDAVNKGQLDAAVQGFTWKDPVAVLKMVNDSDAGGTPPTAGQVGEARVVNNWGGGFTDGDIVEWSGSAWVVIVDEGGAGEPPDGTRVVVNGTPGGSFTGYAGQIGQYDATGNSWSFYDPADGDAVLVAGENSLYENNGYVWDDPATSWIQFTGAGQIIAGDGLSKDGNTLDVNAGDGISIVGDRVTVDLETTNPSLALTGTTPDKTLDVKKGDGLTSDANGLKVDLEDASLRLVGTSPDAQLGVNPGDGISIDATYGVQVDLTATNPGLELTGTSPNKTLQAKVDGAHGIIRAASGLEIEIDDTPDTLDVDADGLKVVGVPLNFKVNDVATSANVTAANLDELTGGGSTSLHSHAGSDAAERVERAHAVDEAVAVADPVYISSANRIGKALANNNAKARTIGVARTAQSTVGQNSDIVHHGLAIGILSGATPGTPYYLQAAGGIGTSLPGASNRVIQMGVAYDTDDLWVQIHDYGKKAA